MSEKPLISFDYAIKYLLKDKGDYEIVENFISALLASEGYKPVKIKALLESESNKESVELKKSIADLIVEDEDGTKYIVEIDRATSSFLHKACFNSSRLISDSMSSSNDYTNIKKIFHISLIYFSTKEMEMPIYHGKTIFHGVDTAVKPLDINIINQGLVKFANHNVFPEYFVISVPLFNDVINQEIDEWMYVMKHSEVKEDFKSPSMTQIAERLSVLKMNEEERANYYHYLKDIVHSDDVIATAKKEAREEGKEEEKIEVAINMLKENLSESLISSITGLPIDTIKSLRTEI